jgi:hypothetical protein
MGMDRERGIGQMHLALLRDRALIIEVNKLRSEVWIECADILRKGFPRFRQRPDARNAQLAARGLNKGFQKRMPGRMAPHNAPFGHAKTISLVAQSRQWRRTRWGKKGHENKSKKEIKNDAPD